MTAELGVPSLTNATIRARLRDARARSQDGRWWTELRNGVEVSAHLAGRRWTYNFRINGHPSLAGQAEGVKMAVSVANDLLVEAWRSR